MIQVQCPSCNASYEQDERRLPKGGLNMRCPKCDASFHVDPSGSVSKTKRPEKVTQVGIGSLRSGAKIPPPVPDRPKKSTITGVGLTPTTSESDPATDPQAGTPFDDMVADLPAPRADAGAFGVDLDLELDLDLPSLAAPSDSKSKTRPSNGAFGELDLPALQSKDPVAHSADFELDLDLPVPRTTSDSDLPAPRAPSDIALRAPNPGQVADASEFGELDLPIPRDSIDLPRTSQSLDLPAPKEVTDLPVGRGDLPAPKTADRFGELDLSFPSGNADLPLPVGDLELPQPRRASDRPLPPIREGAGSTGFGELDLGEDEDELEFADVPQEDAPRAAVALPAEIAARPESLRKPRAMAVEAPPARRGRGSIIAFAFLAFLFVVGAALGLTPYGLFGRYAVEQFLPAAQDATSEIQGAEEVAETDTFQDVRESLRMLGAARGQKGLNYDLLARSIVHEALYQLRFGEDSGSSGRVAKLQERLSERGAEPSDLPLADAALAALNGDSNADSLISAARAQRPTDPLVELVAGEYALRRENYEGALSAFRAAAEKTGSARAQWGIARALLHLGSPEAQAAIDLTLQLSGSHADARIAKARFEWLRGNEAEALQLVREAIGGLPVNGESIRAAKSTRAAGYALMGEIHERAGRTGRAGQAFQASLSIDAFRLDALLGSGRVLLSERRWRDALTKFEEVTENRENLTGELWSGDPPEVQARIGMVQALLQLDQANDARATLAQLGPEHATNLNVMRWLGKIDEALGEYERSEQYYRRMIELAPTQIDGYIALADLFHLRQRPDALAEILNQARAHVVESAVMRCRLGEAELARNEVERALREFRRAVELDRDEPAALFGLGISLRRSGQISEASEVFDRLASVDSRYPGLSLQRGMIFEAQGRAEEAVRSYRAALLVHPNDLDLKLRLGAALVAAHQADEAEEVLTEVMRLRSNSAETEYYMGRVNFVRGQMQVAVRHFDRAVALDPLQAEYLFYLGWAHLEDGQLGHALEAVDRAIELDPDHGDAHWIRGRARLRAGAVADALEDLQRALELRPSRFEAHAAMAECLDQLDRKPEAIREYQLALEQDDTRGDWWFRLGQFRLEVAQLGEASAALTRAIELGSAMEPPANYLPLAYRARGDVARLEGNRDAAIRDYREFLASDVIAGHDRAEVEALLEQLSL